MELLLPTNPRIGFFLLSIYNDRGQLWLVNSISSSMISKYDGSNNDLTRVYLIGGLKKFIN
jgi:hypothetical protein